MIGCLKLYFAKRMAGFVLGLCCLGWVAEHVGPPYGSAIVHVEESGVEMSVGGLIMSVDEPSYDPIVCELPPGQHELALARGDRVLFRETFTIHRIRGTVLTAWDPARRHDRLDPSPSDC